MVVQASEKTIEQYEEELTKQIADMTFVISGLENYAPFVKIIEQFKEMRQDIDDNWHMLMDQNKLAELRMTKFALQTLIEYVPNMKLRREKLQTELAKMLNPDDIIQKDYDNA